MDNRKIALDSSQFNRKFNSFVQWIETNGFRCFQTAVLSFKGSVLVLNSTYTVIDSHTDIVIHCFFTQPLIHGMSGSW